MKNKILLSLVLLGGILFSSCDDFLTEEPSVTLPPEEAISRLKDLEYAVNGVLSTSLNRYYYGGDFVVSADLKGSDCRSIGGNNQISPVGRYQHTQYTDYSRVPYLTGYTMLARINNIIENSADLPETDPTDQSVVKARLMGELYALRGLVHFDMARLYAQLPTVATDLNAVQSGVPISDKVFPREYRPLRATLTQTYKQVVDDLTQGITLLEPYKGSKVNGRINYWGTKALRARAYLYLGQNNEALADAVDVITNSGYTLLTKDGYAASWEREGASETIFEILTTDLYNAQRNSPGFYCAAAGYGEVAATDAFRTFLDADPTNLKDVRSKIIVYEQSSTGSNKGYYIKKYPGRGNLYVNNIRVIRLAEVYLIAAEAAVKGGTATGALGAEEYINKLRQNRIEGYTDVASVTLTDVLNERRKELAAEGHMVWDQWRNGLDVFSFALNTTVSRTDYRCILPIPQRERDINEDLKQNPGY